MFSNDIKSNFGFHPMQEAYWLSERKANPQLLPARVVRRGQDHYWVQILGQIEATEGRLRGQLHWREEHPVVGDWVLIDMQAQGIQPIAAILPRQNALSRFETGKTIALVANINCLLLITSFNADFNVRRLERGLALANEAGARPMIIVNKLDLITKSEDWSRQLQDLEERTKCEVLKCSALTGEGVDSVKKQFHPGDTICLFGMSGVGKSSLVNAFLGDNKQKTSAIREDDARGRHTTTARELMQAAEGFWLLDSPGVREFAIGTGDLRETFSDIETLAGQCRFGDCRHQSEPGCAIQVALHTNQLDMDQWEHFLKLQREQAHFLRKTDKKLQSEYRKEIVKRHRSLRQHHKSRPK